MQRRHTQAAAVGVVERRARINNDERALHDAATMRAHEAEKQSRCAQPPPSRSDDEESCDTRCWSWCGG